MKDDLIEQMRWSQHRYTFNTPEEFEGRRGTGWYTEGRNHGTWQKPDASHYDRTNGLDSGIQREERDGSGCLEVVDTTLPAARRLIEGRTIVAFEREADSGEDFSHGENTVTITLDDGAVLNFTGVGYDASGCVTTYSPGESTPSATEGTDDA